MLPEWKNENDASHTHAKKMASFECDVVTYVSWHPSNQIPRHGVQHCRTALSSTIKTCLETYSWMPGICSVTSSTNVSTIPGNPSFRFYSMMAKPGANWFCEIYLNPEAKPVANNTFCVIYSNPAAKPVAKNLFCLIYLNPEVKPVAKNSFCLIYLIPAWIGLCQNWLSANSELCVWFLCKYCLHLHIPMISYAT